MNYSDREVFTRHGGAYDRGSADARYGRPAEPHYFTGDTYRSAKIEWVDMSEESILDWQLVEDDFQTNFERDQLLFDGEIRYPTHVIELETV